MDIQSKSCPSAKIENVHETMLDGERGYAYTGHVSSIFYPSTHWEPVEEWVDIQVPKSEVRRLPYYNNYMDGCGLKWRYPQ